MLVRKMRKEDIMAVAELEKEAFSEPWSKKALEESFLMDNYCFLVVEDEGEVAGYAGMYTVLDEGNITNVAVFKKWQHHGAGTMLMDEMLRIGEEKKLFGITLEVRAGNEKAYGLYEKEGFVKEGIRKNFYSNPTEDAVIMWYYYKNIQNV